MTRAHMNLVSSAALDAPGTWLRTAPVQDGGVIVHVAGRSEELPRLASVIEAIEHRAAFDQLVLDAGAGPALDNTLAQFGVIVPVRRLARRPELPEDVLSTLRACQCTALVVHVDDDAGLACALAAARLGISIVRIGGAPQSGPGRVIARLADVLLTRSPMDALTRPAMLLPERVVVIGNPLVEVVERHARAALAAAAWRAYDVSPGGYVLATLTGAVPFAQIEQKLSELASRFPLILEAPSSFDVPGARIAEAPSFLERLSLERAATAIFTDSARVHEEAAVLGVPCLAVNGSAEAPEAALVCGAPRGNGPDGVTPWDRRAGERASDALVANFARVRLPV
jgi:hypothetical protein